MPSPNYVAPLRLKPEAHLRNWAQHAERGFRATMLTGEARARADGADVEFAILDVIGVDWIDGAITAVMVERELKKFPQAKKIRVLLNSPGGVASEGIAIYNLLKRHPAEVEVEVIGEAASAASVIAMAGNRIIMRTGTWMMIHRGLSFAFGHSDELRNAADALDVITGGAVDIYAEKTGLDRDEVETLVEATTWLSAHKALELGFAHELGDGEAAPAPSADLENENEDIDVRIHVAVNQAPLRGLMSKPAPAMGRTQPPEKNMAGEDKDKGVLQLLGVNTAAEAVARQAVLGRIETLTGKSGDEAIGVLMAWKASHEQLPQLQAQQAELSKAAEAADLEKAIGDAKQAHKLAPGEEATLRQLVTSGELSTKAAKAMLATKVAIPQLAKSTPGASAIPDVVSDVSLKHEGKSYAELKPAQRAALKKSNPDLYEAMKKNHESAGA